MSDAGVEEDAAPPLGLRSWAVILAFYAVVLALATYPMVASIATALPSGPDPLQHLTVMRWYKSCLVAGRSPMLCQELQYPVGVPLANFSPLILQSLLYIPLSAATANDVLSYNVIWIVGILTTGLGAFALAYRMVGDRACATFAGMAAMLSGPVMLHAHGHLELIYVGTFAFFLLAWIRFVDAPSPGRLLVAAGLYWIMVMGAAYFAVLGAVPAAWYAALGAAGAGRAGLGGWLKARAGWFIGFALLALVGSCGLFGAQIWGLAHGGSMGRPFAEFARMGAPWWSYLVPTVLHNLHPVLVDADPYDPAGHPAVECGSYLGVVTLALIAYAATNRAGLARRAYWWSVLAVLVVLGMGAYARIGSEQVPLPGLWLWRHSGLFRLLRAPGRFNLLVAIAAAVVASAGLKHLLARLPSPASGVVAWTVLAVGSLADLAMVPFASASSPEPPACYARILRDDPGATFLEVPAESSGTSSLLGAATGYWQGGHGGRTSGGYSGIANTAFDNRVVHNSPFSFATMDAPGYLPEGGATRFGIVADADFMDYAWLTLTSNDFRYIVLHRGPGLMAAPPAGVGRFERAFAPAKVFEEPTAVVYDRALLAPPGRPTLVCLDGWRGGWHGRERLVASKDATLAAFNPDPGRAVTFRLTASAFRSTRAVRLRDGDVDLAAWRVDPGVFREFESLPIRLPAGVRRLSLVSDGDERPRHRHEEALGGDTRPYSLNVTRISLGPCREIQTKPIGSRPVDGPRLR